MGMARGRLDNLISGILASGTLQRFIEELSNMA